MGETNGAYYLRTFMKIVSIASARPNFVKLAAVHHALAAHKDIEHIIIHTGQHYDPLFSEDFFTQLAIPAPTINLEIFGGTNEEQQQRVEATLREALPTLKPDILLVYGDVNGAAAAARAAASFGIKIGHIEAGLRSFDDTMPEEHNRIAIDRLSSLLFVTEQSGIENLKKENLAAHAHLVGNTMIDTLVRMLPAIQSYALPANITSPYVVVTLHRPSNVDQKETLSSLITFLTEIHQHVPVVFPVHRRTQARFEEFGLSAQLSGNIHCIEPLSYLPFLRLVHDASFIITDSGGIQEEAAYLQKKCFTLRKNTERPSTIESGSNELIDFENQEDRARVLDFAHNPITPKITVPSLWDGHAGERIAEILRA